MKKFISSLLVLAMVFGMWAVCFADSEKVEQESCSMAHSVYAKIDTSIRTEEIPKEDAIISDLKVSSERDADSQHGAGIIEYVAGVAVVAAWFVFGDVLPSILLGVGIWYTVLPILVR